MRNKAKLACRCHWPSSRSLILGGQIVHINEAKGNLFSTKDNVYSPHIPPTPPQIIYFPFLIFLFIFIFPRPHRPYIDPTLTLHRPFVLTQFISNDINREKWQFYTTTFLIIPTSSPSFLLFSLLLLLLVSMVLIPLGIVYYAVQGGF